MRRTQPQQAGGAVQGVGRSRGAEEQGSSFLSLLPGVEPLETALPGLGAPQQELQGELRQQLRAVPGEGEGDGEGEVSHVSPGGLCAPGAPGGAEPGVLVEQDVVEDAELRRVARSGDRALGGKGEVQGREHRAHHPLRQGLVQGVVVLGEVQVQVQVVQVVQMKVEEEVHLGEGGGGDQDGGDEHGGGEHGVEGGRGGHDLLVDPPLYAHPGKVDGDGGAGARCKVQGAR